MCGGGVVLRPENSLDNVFFFSFLLVLNLFYSLQRGSNGFIIAKTILFQRIEGSTFSRDVGGGVQGPSANFYRNRYNL